VFVNPYEEVDDLVCDFNDHHCLLLE